MRKARLVFIIVLVLSHAKLAAQFKNLEISPGQKIAPIQTTMWGIFFEDINFAADGGLYAELVKNRSFEFADPWMGWDVQSKNADMLFINRGIEGNARYARISLHEDSSHFNLLNEGFRGMGIHQNNEYEFSILASSHDASRPLVIELVDSNRIIGSATINITPGPMQRYTARIVSTATTPKAMLKLKFAGKGVVDIDFISLFPVDTWKQRPGGLRKDLVQLLADMKPGFVRFPGGCIVEGRDLANRYQWKKTVGAPVNRQSIINRWNTEFQHKLTPDYFQSYGLGFFEYFLLSEDIGAEPLPILNCGMACQFNTGEVVPTDQLDPYIQDALDLIEFANGSVETKWGRLRADMGHPAPFHLKMMGVGNEQWGPQYLERYKVFANTIKAKYPEIKLISSVGPFAGGELFNYLNPRMRELHADLLDEHYYMAPEFFLRNATRYDNYDRKGSKIFAGEYAAHVRNTDGQQRNCWQAALAEAAFMTGLERNAEVVHMSSYAPLFAHADAWQWAPDLIWFNSLNAYGTPNYYVQKLFSTNRGTNVVPITEDQKALTGQDSLYATAAMDEQAGELILKLVNVSSSDKSRSLVLNNWKPANRKAFLTILRADARDAVNSFANPKGISPTVKEIIISKKNNIIEIPAGSLVIVRIRK